MTFYSQALGFSEAARPIDGVLVMSNGSLDICLLEKAAGSSPAPGSSDKRGYDRHWTPVHLDFHVDHFAEAKERAVAAGALCEQVLESPKHGSVAFCSDPFGHGFCLIERKQ